MTAEPGLAEPVRARAVAIGHDGAVSIPDVGLDRASLRERLADVMRRDIVEGAPAMMNQSLLRIVDRGGPATQV